MREIYVPTPQEAKLTVPPVPSYARRSMPDGTSGVDSMQKVGQSSTEAGRGVNVSESRSQSSEQMNALRQRWHNGAISGLTSKELSNPDTRATIEAAIRMGFGPGDMTSKGVGATRASEVVRNVVIPDTPTGNNVRLEKAKEVLGITRELKDREANAILKAHRYKVAKKDGKESGAFNYSVGELKEKTRILMEEGGFTQEEARKILAAGIAAEPLTVPVTDPELQGVVDEINTEVARVNAINPAEDLNRYYVQEQLERMRNIRDRASLGIREAQAVGDAAAEAQARQIRQEAQEVIASLRLDAAGMRIVSYQDREEAWRAAHPGEDFYSSTDRDAEALRAERASMIEEIHQRINEAPSIETHHFPPELLRDASEFAETREYLINKIIFKSYEDPSETNRYEINLYASGNLDTLMGYLQVKDHRRYLELLQLRTAAELFHSMNSTILSGNLENFIRIAENINVAHFTAMQGVRGAPLAMRLFEQKFQEQLARDSYISSEGYATIKREVQEQLREMNRRGIISSEYTNQRFGTRARTTTHGQEVLTEAYMEEWELDRAYNVAKAFYNLTFRAAEQIARGTVGEGADRWKSYPQEAASRMMNFMRWFAYRFNIGDSRGGQKFLDMIAENYFERLHETGNKLGINRIKTLGGTSVWDFEQAGVFSLTGILSGYRLKKMAQTQIILRDGRTLEEWTNEAIQNIDHVKGASRHDQEEILAAVTPILNDLDIGLSALLMDDSLVSGAKGYLARRAIWEKVAETNVPLMMNYLTGIEFNGAASAMNIDTILQRTVGFGRMAGGQENPDWIALKAKILRNHEIRLAIRSGRTIQPDPADQLTGNEQAFVRLVQEEGRKLAPHLADIVFTYLPFSNDIPFEELDWTAPGEEFYKRRIASDIPSLNSGQMSALPLLSNPGGTGIEQAMEILGKVVQGIESSDGAEEGQKRVFPVVETWIDFVTTTPHKRQVFLKEFLHTIHAPTSIAQEFAGMDAASYNVAELRGVLQSAQKHGLLSHHQVDEMKKKKKITLVNLMIELFMDFFLFTPYEVGREFADTLTPGK